MDSDYDELIDSLPPGLRRQVIRALRREPSGPDPPLPSVELIEYGEPEPLTSNEDIQADARDWVDRNFLPELRRALDDDF
jgi:hypothetical protein